MNSAAPLTRTAIHLAASAMMSVAGTFAPAAALLSISCALTAAPAVAGPAAAQDAPSPPKVEPVPEPPPPIGFADDTLERAVRVIPDVESREERVVDGKRTIHVKTKSGAEYLLTEDDGVAVTTVLQPETQRFRVPSWILREW
jgi:hypothetical protein